MEHITIEIKGSDSNQIAARLMRVIYKTMAAIDSSKCHIDIHSESARAEYEEISIPEFMEASGRPVARLAGGVGRGTGGRRSWQ